MLPPLDTRLDARLMEPPDSAMAKPLALEHVTPPQPMFFLLFTLHHSVKLDYPELSYANLDFFEPAHVETIRPSPRLVAPVSPDRKRPYACISAAAIAASRGDRSIREIA